MGFDGRTPRRSAAILVAAVLIVAGAACGGDDGGAGSERLPALELPRLGEGDPLALDTIDGPAVVNLWATWCAPCRRELPDFQEVHEQRGDEVRFVGVNIGDRAGPASAFLDEVDVTFENYLDFEGRLTEELRTATMPVTVITDRDGDIAVVHSGPMDVDQLTDQIELVLSGAPGP
ncbi:MAG: TlpA disulfide reductase family protein [Ilumatobacteraceae bacterium]